ncbi:hypothetical protein HYDPIDRAFT_81113 [Hydnomerulius pinastri MD-312]|nr:hypothetical protein HYDPIDRAFT_81113 [Hydnomerulius pinastri MD-312]
MIALADNFSELLGYTSICCWLGAQFPQILENIKQQSCESLALPFLFNWMLGDASNLIGCLLTRQLPFQTYLATYFCFVDCCLLYQYFYFGGGPTTSPNVYAHPRSRATSSAARRLSVDASHYRNLSVVAGSVAVAAALAAHPDSHPEHRRPKHGEERPLDGPTPRASVELEDDAMLSALSDSFHSESGKRKRVSWSQERQVGGGSTGRRQMSPVIHTSLQSTAAAAALARGRPLQREGESGEEEEEEHTERRAGSRASRRGAGMVLLGVWALFGIGRFASGGLRPLVGRGESVGAVLVTSSNFGVSSPASGLTVEIADPHPSFINVEMPSLLVDDIVGQERQPEEEPSYEHVIGRIFAWLCTTLYLTSRLPQIWKNYVRKSVEGLSMYLFVFAFLGNFFYVLSLLTSPGARAGPPTSTAFFQESIPYLLGSGGTFVFDITIVTQSFIYKGKSPRRDYIRSRGNSIVRSPTIAEEEAGLLRGDALAESKGRLPERSTTSNIANNQSLSEPKPDHLRKLVLDYLCHNCYTKTAQAFTKDGAVRHLDKDGDEIPPASVRRNGTDGRTVAGARDEGSAADLSIRTQILSGKVEEATVLLNQHFPKVLTEDGAYDADLDTDVEMDVVDEANSDHLKYTTGTVNPVHLSLNLRILAFIEACRTIPLVYVPPHWSTTSGSPMSVDSDIAPLKRDPKNEDKHQTELLIRAQKLYSTVNALHKAEERTIYQKELSNVGGLLAYKVPENSPMSKYLHQERRDRVAEQINSAILYSTNMSTVSHLELAVRYTYSLWDVLHELRVKVPANSRRPTGVTLPPTAKTQSTGGSEKDASCEVSPPVCFLRGAMLI